MILEWAGYTVLLSWNVSGIDEIKWSEVRHNPVRVSCRVSIKTNGRFTQRGPRPYLRNFRFVF